MPDIGLLQSRAPRPHLVPPPVIEPGEEVAASFLAPVDRAIPAPIAVVSAPLVDATPVIAAIEPPAAAIPMSENPQEAVIPSRNIPPSVMRAAPPPIGARDLWWLLLALLVIVGTGVGVRDPWPADEPRFAALARDMVNSHEWLFPRVGGDLYQDKPPLFFWMLAVCYSLFGSVKASFLIPSLLSAAGTLFCIYDLGRRLVSREAGLAAALLCACTLQFVMVNRGAQIDATLCFLTTFSMYALLRHLLLGEGWGWYFLGGFAAGLGIFTKGVGFLPVLLLIPYFSLRAARWKGLPVVDAGAAGWRWWLAPLAMLLAVSLWFVPMLVAVATSGSPEYAAYRDEILFKQTVGRYAASWHHVKSWYYFIVEVVPPLWLPWSLLLFWLVPRFKAAFRDRDARVWVPLFWVLIVLLFFSLSPGKRGIYILPALPALAIASMPFLESILGRAGVRRAGFVLAGLFVMGALAFVIGDAAHATFAIDALAAANLDSAMPFYVFLVLCAAALAVAYRRAPLAAWPAALGSLCLVFSYFIAPAMNGERSGKDFVHAMLKQVKPEEQLALVAYKEQFLLYLDRPTVNFGHRRWLEGPQEAYDAAAWLEAAPNRVLLVPFDVFKSDPTAGCFIANTLAGTSSDEDWYLVRAPASSQCAHKGDASKAISYNFVER